MLCGASLAMGEIAAALTPRMQQRGHWPPPQLPQITHHYLIVACYPILSRTFNCCVTCCDVDLTERRGHTGANDEAARCRGDG